MHKDDCIFCKISQGKAPCHKVWEDEHHLAFLSTMPNTDGVTVLIPKDHYESYVFDLPSDIYHELLVAAQAVGKLLDAAFEDVARTGLIFEGYGVNHVHAKLYPMHGTANNTWKSVEIVNPKYFDFYEGYLSTWGSDNIPDSALAAIAQKIRQAAR